MQSFSAQKQSAQKVTDGKKCSSLYDQFETCMLFLFILIKSQVNAFFCFFGIFS